MKNKSLHLKIFSLSLILTGTIAGGQPLAAAPSPTPSPVPVSEKSEKNATSTAISTSSAETQKVLENLEKIARDSDKSDQIKNIYDDINIKKRGYIAQVISIKDKTVKVKSTDETEQFLTFDKSTTLISKGKETTADQAEISDWINIDGWLVIIGVEEEDQFLPRRVLISSVDLAPREKVVRLGSVKEITKTKLTYTPKNSEEAQEMKIDKNTNLEDKDGNTIKWSQIKPDMQLLTTGISNSAGNTVTATTLRILSPIE